jgi:hypothetical protein
MPVTAKGPTCEKCGKALDSRGRTRGRKCRACRTLRDRLSGADCLAVIRSAPTAWIVSAIEARGVQVVDVGPERHGCRFASGSPPAPLHCCFPVAGPGRANDPMPLEGSVRPAQPVRPVAACDDAWLSSGDPEQGFEAVRAERAVVGFPVGGAPAAPFGSHIPTSAQMGDPDRKPLEGVPCEARRCPLEPSGDRDPSKGAAGARGGR